GSESEGQLVRARGLDRRYLSPSPGKNVILSVEVDAPALRGGPQARCVAVLLCDHHRSHVNADAVGNQLSCTLAREEGLIDGHMKPRQCRWLPGARSQRPVEWKNGCEENSLQGDQSHLIGSAAAGPDGQFTY